VSGSYTRGEMEGDWDEDSMSLLAVTHALTVLAVTHKRTLDQSSSAEFAGGGVKWSLLLP